MQFDPLKSEYSYVEKGRGNDGFNDDDDGTYLNCNKTNHKNNPINKYATNK